MQRKWTDSDLSPTSNFAVLKTRSVDAIKQSTTLEPSFATHVISTSASSIVEITVDPKGVAKLLEGLNVHKALGPDGLNARVN